MSSHSSCFHCCSVITVECLVTDLGKFCNENCIRTYYREHGKELNPLSITKVFLNEWRPVDPAYTHIYDSTPVQRFTMEKLRTRIANRKLKNLKNKV